MSPVFEDHDDEERDETVAELSAEVISRFEKACEPTPDDPSKSPTRIDSVAVEWNVDRGAEVIFQSDNVITFDLRNRGFLGGAHGFDERTLMSFDLNDGHRIVLDELIAQNSRSVLETVAEVEFRRVRSIAPGKTLQEAGFAFPAGKPFAIPDNFGITAQGLLIYYNPYDIAAYSFGPTQVLLPMEAVGPLMRSDTPLTARLVADPQPTLEAPHEPTV